MCATETCMLVVASTCTCIMYETRSALATKIRSAHHKLPATGYHRVG